MSSMVGGTADPDELQAVGTPEEPLLSAGSPDDAAQQLGQVQETEQEKEQGQDDQQAQVVSDNVPTPTPPPSASHAASPKSVGEAPPKPTLAGGFTSWAKGFRLPSSAAPENPPQASAEAPRSTFSLLTGGFGKRAVAKTPVAPPAEHRSQVSPVTEGALGTFTKGFLDTSRNAVKVVQIKARHMVSQNKRRYQEGAFDLDMTYITENVIAMGFPAGDISSGFLGYVEGLYRNHMEDVVQFFETHHKGKYKVYNLCSERLYDAALFEGKVACFPFNDHNCPPLHLIGAFCQSAYSWLKGDLENVVVVHCKAGKARTGLMISSLLLYLKFFPTAEESIQYYNQKRCVDGKGLILPSQVRYVKYFERILRDFNGETPSVRKCIFRGIRLHKCPYWIRPAITISDHNGVLFSTKKHPRTKDMMPDDFWFNAPRKGIVVFALPGERCVAELNGDFKVHFQDRHGDFYCWLNTNMMENRLILNAHELDGFDKRKLPSPGFQVEVVILDFDAPLPARRPVPTAQPAVAPPSAKPAEQLGSQESTGAVGDGKADDIFSDSDGEEGSKSGSHRSSKKAAQEEKPTEEKEVESKSQPEGEVPSSNSFGAFSNAFSSMRNAMDRVRITQNPWVVGAKPSSADNAEGASAAGATEGAPKEGDKVSLEVSKAGQGVERVEQTSGGSELAPGEPGQKEIPSPAQEVVGSAADGKEPGHEVPAGAETSGVEQPDDSATPSDFKAMAAANAADASLFTFGDDEDYDSEEEG